MKTYLLLGAGFSRNWGGWLAAEAFEYLLGCKEVKSHPSLARLLWQKKDQGGFEAALETVQTQRDGFGKPELEAFQSAVTRMFDDMNSGYHNLPNGMEFNNQIGFPLREMLVRFDAIFTLNQDLLLEYHYINDNIALAERSRWSGAYLPGVRRNPPQNTQLGAAGWREVRWIVGDGRYEAAKNVQPIYKLHGSVQWMDEAGAGQLVIGGAKSATIARTPLLAQYHKDFEARLAEPDARLMVIGYSFSDGHINQLIQRAAQSGLRCFIIDPLGVDVADPTRNAAIRAENPFQKMIFGASRRTLREVFSGDRVEHAKIMRFFEA